MTYLLSHLDTEYIIGIKRVNRLELPEAALREALLNAIAHRNYRSAANIQIYIFKDKLEIVNPGGLVAGLKKEDLGRKSMPRNPLLFSLMHRMRLVENIGSGFKRIHDAMTGYGFGAPLIEADADWFSITFHRPPKTRAQAQKRKKTELTRREKSSVKSSVKIIELLRENSEISIPEIADRIGKTTRAVEKQIAILKAKGSIRRIGPAKGGRWEVIEEK